MRYCGKVVYHQFAAGSKSEHRAVVLMTSAGPLKLRMYNGNPFRDPELEKLIGLEIVAEGEIHQGQLLMTTSWRLPVNTLRREPVNTLRKDVFEATGYHLVNRTYSLFVGLRNSIISMTSRPQEAILFPTLDEAKKSLVALLATKQYGEYVNDPLVCKSIDEQYDPLNWLVVPASIRIEHGEAL